MSLLLLLTLNSSIQQHEQYIQCKFQVPYFIDMADTYKKITENKKYCLSRAEGLISSELIRMAFHDTH